MRGTFYQIVLIFLLVLTAAGFGVFVYREVYPEYKVYQNAYSDLEQFRSSLTHTPPPAFEFGVKQIVLPDPGGHPERIDRCTSCHVALQIEYFSPTKVARDVNGEVIRDANGLPVKVPNEDYIFRQVDNAIRDLEDEKVNEQILSQGDTWRVTERHQKAERLKDLKSVRVNGRSVDLTKVLAMHPLIGQELRPFEYHNPDDMGCTSCHNGNGRALTSDKAHGPVFDGEYEVSFEGPEPQFLESDPKNDPSFSRIFNNKPGADLVFQTTPIFVGGLIEANCIQCHQSSSSQLSAAVNAIESLRAENQSQSDLLQKSYEQAQQAVTGLVVLEKSINEKGLESTVKELRSRQADYTLPQDVRSRSASQIKYIEEVTASTPPNSQQPELLNKIHRDLVDWVGSEPLVETLHQDLFKSDAMSDVLESFVSANQTNPHQTGRLFINARAAAQQKQLIADIEQAHASVKQSIGGPAAKSFHANIDLMTTTYQDGKALFMSQACYACHRIAGYSRGGVGPNLTEEGTTAYPWFIKQKLVWPQGSFHDSTMPEMRLDHKQLEPLMTFLLAQKGRTNSISDVDYKIDIKQWEAGKKLPWEEPLKPDQIYDIDNSMTIFATEGCAACHRLHGFVSDVGYAIEKDAKPTFDALKAERQWFQGIIPEMVFGADIPGSQIVEALEKHGKEIDRRIVDGVRKDSLLEKIEQSHPGLLASFYSNFEYALRAKNHDLEQAADQAATPSQREAKLAEQKQWKERVRRVLMLYIQEYGLGRLIGPRPNWSGIYRSDQWLMEHFREPSAQTTRSLMPVFPFDESKFLALTYMLDIVGRRNLDWTHSLWQKDGFNPAEAYQLHCAQCHGMSERRDEAPVLPWIYPLPKNLRNATFLRNLTRPRIVESITHGVKGTPMPPWGETAHDKPFQNDIPVLRPNEIQQLVDWLFRSLPGSEDSSPRDVLKWDYTPENVLRELKKEGDTLKGNPPPAHTNDHSASDPDIGQYYASLTPPKVMANKDSVTVADVFDIKVNPVVGGVDTRSYYIQQRYYTPANLESGKQLFLENCAVCHGADGAGDGIRASEMIDAKPRNFMNVNWARTRDDLRLLRSIKYGVPGTAMGAWGDMTSTLQRLQLVMYIRQLGQDLQAHDELETTLYKVYNTAVDEIQKARTAHYAAIERIRADYETAKELRQDLDAKAMADPAQAKGASATYEKELAAHTELKKQEAIDATFQELIRAVEAERSLLEKEGKTLLNLQSAPDLDQEFLKLIELDEGRFKFDQGTLAMSPDPAPEKIKQTHDAMLRTIDRQIDELKSNILTTKGKLSSTQQRKEIQTLQDQIGAMEKLKNELTAVVADMNRLRDQQRQVYNKVQSQLKKQAA